MRDPQKSEPTGGDAAMLRRAMNSDRPPSLTSTRTLSAGLSSPWLPGMVVALALIVLASILLLARQQLRAEVRAQMVARDAAVLHEVALIPSEENSDGGNPLSDMDDPSTQLTLLLRTSKLRGVLAARLYDPSGAPVQSFPANVRESELPDDELSSLQRLQPIARFHPAMKLSDLVFLLSTPTTPESGVPIVEVAIPLHAPPHTELAGIAQFWIDGTSIATEFSRLEVHLNRQVWIAFLAGGSLISLSILFAFHRLRRSHGDLAQRTEALQQANQELVTAAKTSAVGALTTHLVHELKNPLSGVCNFLASASALQSTNPDPAMTDALSAARRMQSTIHEIVSMLREEQHSIHYRLPLAELAEIVTAKLRERAAEKQVRIEAQVQGGGELSNRSSNLIALILVNLGENAIHATPAGSTVTLGFEQKANAWEFTVRDQGPGMPEAISRALFQPGQTAREGGTGLGLSICKQLANHLNAQLELVAQNAAGCQFKLTVPEDADRSITDS